VHQSLFQSVGRSRRNDRVRAWNAALMKDMKSSIPS
jgi:hypothetical protein